MTAPYRSAPAADPLPPRWPDLLRFVATLALSPAVLAIMGSPMLLPATFPGWLAASAALVLGRAMGVEAVWLDGDEVPGPAPIALGALVNAGLYVVGVELIVVVARRKLRSSGRWRRGL
jgi:hypothetical protein